MAESDSRIPYPSEAARQRAITVRLVILAAALVGALIGLIKGKTGDVPGSENGVEMVVPEKGRDRGGEDKGGVRKNRKQKIEMEKSKETKEQKKQSITNLPEGQI